VNRPDRGREASWLARAARAATDRLRSKPIVVRRRLVYSFDLRTPVPVVESALPLRFEIVPDPDRRREPSTPQGESDLLFRAVAGNDDAYRMRIAFRRDELLHLLVGCAVPARPMFLYDCFTNPAFRGKAVYPCSLTRALRYGQDRGYDRAYIRVARSNAPSIIGIERAGFRPAAVVIHAAVLGLAIGPFGRAAQWALRERERAR